jgi:hypothetical protein
VVPDLAALLKTPPSLLMMISSRLLLASGFSLQKLVQVRDVRVVVLAVVKLERLLADVRSEGLLVVREGGKRERHGVSP